MPLLGRLVHRLKAEHHLGDDVVLDLVRFAETNGFETNRERPNAWPYRDYVIRSLNEDKPYNQFIREQIAGDALGVPEASAFLVAGPHDIVKSPDINLTLMQRQNELCASTSAGMSDEMPAAFRNPAVTASGIFGPLHFASGASALPTAAQYANGSVTVDAVAAGLGISYQKSEMKPCASAVNNCLPASGLPFTHFHSYTVARPVTTAGMKSAFGFAVQYSFIALLGVLLKSAFS